MFSNINQTRGLRAAKTVAELGFFAFALFALALAVVMIALLNREGVWLYTLGWTACGGAFVCLLGYGSLELLLEIPDAGRTPHEAHSQVDYPHPHASARPAKVGTGTSFRFGSGSGTGQLSDALS